MEHIDQGVAGVHVTHSLGGNNSILQIFLTNMLKLTNLKISSKISESVIKFPLVRGKNHGPGLIRTQPEENLHISDFTDLNQTIEQNRYREQDRGERVGQRQREQDRGGENGIQIQIEEKRVAQRYIEQDRGRENRIEGERMGQRFRQRKREQSRDIQNRIEGERMG